MSMSDPLADMLTRIRNASMAHYPSVDMPFSNLKKGVAAILKQEGYISDLAKIDEGHQGVLRLDLKYDQNDRAVITGISRASKPGRRMYTKTDKIPKVMSGLGVSILSTSQGVMTDIEARKLGVGGEILCKVW
ncbi:MAG: 30S ribosomal protein S8 [Desulfobulbaceae bacterium]|uniref:Small ribosomal subunit protein uS8 n=1 Tax=Candidatus Desulfobia pelagia TaxID=2841692 RepID=A0A8J6NDM5_9BACT|nr:30S ribosomal protein S8 [Candidatus Desulfobia pelagia]